MGLKPMEKQNESTMVRVGDRQNWPNPESLKTANEIGGRYHLSPGRLVELAEAGFAPHFRIDGGDPLFKLSEIKEWISDNCLERWDGKRVPWEVTEMAVTLLSAKAEGVQRPPESIVSVDGLAVLQNINCPGVYFLCLGDLVVYVGQSVVPSVRVAHHTREGKDLDRVYLLPVPKSRLDDVEGSFIRHLQPILNGSNGPRPVGGVEVNLKSFLSVG